MAVEQQEPGYQDRDYRQHLGRPQAIGVAQKIEAVGAEPFGKEAANRIDDPVKQENIAVAQFNLETALDGLRPHDAEKEDQESKIVPERLIEKGRVEQGVLINPGRLHLAVRQVGIWTEGVVGTGGKATGAVFAGDFDTPGQVGLAAIGFIVHEVAPAPYSLGQHQARGDKVGKAPEAETPVGRFADLNPVVEITVEQRPDDTADDRALDSDTAAPDFKRPGLSRVPKAKNIIFIFIPGIKDIPDAGETNTKDQQYRQNTPDVVGIVAAPLGQELGQESRYNHPAGDYYAVPAKSQTAD